jgi:hypothetical protein
MAARRRRCSQQEELRRTALGASVLYSTRYGVIYWRNDGSSTSNLEETDQSRHVADMGAWLERSGWSARWSNAAVAEWIERATHSGRLRHFESFIPARGIQALGGDRYAFNGRDLEYVVATEVFSPGWPL